jgi:hypothetical protein
MTAEGLRQLDRELSRRVFLRRSFTAAGLVAGWHWFQRKGLAEDSAATPDVAFRVMSAMGALVIPVDEDPGYASFEPGITGYVLESFVQHFVLAGNIVAYEALLGTLRTMHEAPPLIEYGPRFLDMNSGEREKYFTDCLTGQFENEGYGDILGLTAFLGLFAPKAVFFSNYPRHLATPGADIQVLPASDIKTGWDIMGFRGPVSQTEEESLRERFLGIEVLPGIDRNNPYI